MILFEFNCKICKEITIKKLVSISRKRGIKLICLSCLATDWYQYQNIKKYKIKNNF